MVTRAWRAVSVIFRDLPEPCPPVSVILRDLPKSLFLCVSVIFRGTDKGESLSSTDLPKKGADGPFWGVGGSGSG